MCKLRVSVLCLVVLIFFGVTSVSTFAALDNNPSPWRTNPAGGANTTYQSWDFSTSANPSEPDVDLNANGTVMLELTDEDPNAVYYSSGPIATPPHSGVWKYSDNIVIDFPSDAIQYVRKDFWLQITYSGLIPNVILVYKHNSYQIMQLVNNTAIGDGYYYATYSDSVVPNDDFVILIQPASCWLYVDDLIVETISDPNLVGQWKFDGDPNDSSGYGNDGTVTGTETYTTGVVDQCIILDGSNDYITVPDDPSINFGSDTDFSITGWFKTDTCSGGKLILTKWTGNSWPYYSYDVYMEDNGTLTAVVADSNSFVARGSANSLADNQWHHFAMVADRDGYLSLYLDNDLQSFGDISSIGDIDTPNSHTLQIGCTANLTQKWDGELDDIRIYNRVLTEDEIEELAGI